MDNIRVRLIVRGRVQGVWFRDSTRREAVSLGLAGWVRNLPDGSVETLIEGPEDQVRRLVSWCGKGPPSAEVFRVDETRESWKGEFAGFDVVF